MIKSCVFTDELSGDFEKAVRLCAGLHVRYIEPRGIGNSNINEIGIDQAGEMKKIMDRYGVKVGVIGSGFGKCSLDDEEEWKQHLKILERQIIFCELFDTRIIRGFPFFIPNHRDWERESRPNMDTYIDRIAEKLSVSAALAEKEGITISLETEPSTFSGTCTEVAMVIRAVNSPALSCCWDVANSWQFGIAGYPEGYRDIRGTVTHLHIKDAGLDPEDPAKPIGSTYIDRGDIPYPDIFKTLIADGYDGLASVETHLFFHMADRFSWLEPATRDALQNLNRILADVQGGW